MISIVADKYLYFGSYPQSEVLDKEIVNELNKLVTKLPNEKESYDWTNFNYYDNNEIKSFMWFIDIDYNNVKYRGIYFTKIRYGFTNREGYSFSDEERLFPNLLKGTIYWFKFEPIKWMILNKTEEELLLISDLILDHQDYYHNEKERIINGVKIYSNNWEYSNIRKWLNNNFYNQAFNELEKEMIVEKFIDNHNSFNSFSSIYLREQNDTYDKIYLLSYHESLVYFRGSCLCDKTKLTYPTKYAIINLASNGFKPGHKDWYLRTPCNTSSYMVHYTSLGGNVDKETFVYVVEGVRPVINIKMK